MSAHLDMLSFFKYSTLTPPTPTPQKGEGAKKKT